MAGRSSANDALISVESRLVQPPSLVRSIVTRLQVNGSIVPRALPQDVEAPIILHVAYFKIDAKLGHGPLLADLTGAALSLEHRRTADNLFVGNFQAQITVRRRYCVITRAVTGDIKFLVVARLRFVAVECLDSDSRCARAVGDFQAASARFAHDRVHSIGNVSGGSFSKIIRVRAGARPK